MSSSRDAAAGNLDALKVGLREIFDPGQIFQDNADDLFLAFRGFCYNEKHKDFTIYLNEHANVEGALVGERNNINPSLDCHHCYHTILRDNYTYVGAFHELFELL